MGTQPLCYEELDVEAAYRTISLYAPAEVLFEIWKHIGTPRSPAECAADYVADRR
jgi:hypothetical protein